MWRCCHTSTLWTNSAGARTRLRTYRLLDRTALVDERIRPLLPARDFALCDCLQAVSTASSGRLSTTRAIRKQKATTRSLVRTTNKAARRQWAAAATSSASPAARTACSVRGAASHPTLSMASTLADDARPPRHRRDPGKRVASQTLSMRRGALADAPPRPNNTKTQAWSRASSANAATTPASSGRTRSSRALS